MPSRWTRPVVETIALPAHAQTSPGEDGDFFFTFEVSSIDNGAEAGNVASVAPVHWLARLIPSAHAGSPPAPEVNCFFCGICARLRGEDITVTLVGADEEGLDEVCYEGTGKIGQSADLLPVVGSVVCGDDPPPAQLVSLEGDAPNRTLVVSDGTEQYPLVEDPGRSCVCEAFECSEQPK